ncbi:hypothetical protein ACC703_35140 [Rhizobium ruizarguesonis]|nr:hypothetical protein [Rhizobium leguminosarum bv. viciae]
MAMDDVIRKALKKKRELELDLEKLNEFIRFYEELTGTKVVQDEMVSPGEILEDTPSRPKIRVRFPRRPATPERIAQVAAEVIRELGAPIRRGRLVKLIEEKALIINSEDKARYLGTILWRHKDQFTNIEGRGYWLDELGDPPDDD